MEGGDDGCFPRHCQGVHGLENRHPGAVIVVGVAGLQGLLKGLAFDRLDHGACGIGVDGAEFEGNGIAFCQVGAFCTRRCGGFGWTFQVLAHTLDRSSIRTSHLGTGGDCG